MTPVLLGRWQSRWFLMCVFGVLITLPFMALFMSIAPLILLGYVLLIGTLLDVIYDRIQAWRWDNDWSPFAHLVTGILEGALIWFLIKTISVPAVPSSLSITQFLPHYIAVWVFLFMILWGPMKIFFPNWRFSGGRLNKNLSPNHLRSIIQ